MGGQITPLGELRLKVHLRTLAYRNIESLLNSQPFNNLYDKLSDAQKELGVLYIVSGDYNNLVDWYTSNQCVEDLSLRELRNVAAKHKVAYYCRASRTEILQSLRGKPNVKSRNPQRDCGHHQDNESVTGENENKCWDETIRAPIVPKGG